MGRHPVRGGHPRARRFAAVACALATLLLIPAVVAAHPLGNFTINHYAEVRVEPDRVLLDVVIDQAEIAAFQARQAFDLDADGSVSEEEIEASRMSACDEQAMDLRLTADDVELQLRTIEAGLSFPPGVGGLSTMRLVCGYEVALAAPIGADPTRIAFTDESYANRLGWREIVAHGSGVTLAKVEGEVRAESVSARLTAYPPELVALPLADLALVVDATPGGPVLPPLDIPDAEPAGGASASEPPPSASPLPVASASESPRPNGGAVPGGVGGGELPGIFRQDLTPLVLLLSLLTAAALGAGHALTPGHGKTLMAAYLVGTRGRPLHALGLGLSVSLSHTFGILVLAAIVVGASDVLPPDVVVRWAPLVAALSIAVIGGWMLVGELRRRRAAPAPTGTTAHGHDEHGHAHEHDPDHANEHDHGLEHSHGALTHSHVPAPGSTITWRSLFALGLAGGLIPSTSALLILLGSIAAGRPAFGFVLVVAFGLGMAAVMSGIGLLFVAARTRLDRLPAGERIGRIRETVPLIAAVLVFAFGLLLTAQAIGAAPTL
jgi:ABC-type nickel/cobalt efflux system permease component RcnA